MDINVVACIGRIILFQIILLIEARIVVGYIVLFKKKALNRDEQDTRFRLFRFLHVKGFAFDIICFIFLAFLRMFDPPLFPFWWVYFLVIMFAMSGLLLYITQVWIAKQLKMDVTKYHYVVNLRQGNGELIKATFISVIISLLFASCVELFMLSVPIGVIVLGISSLLFGFIMWKKIIPVFEVCDTIAPGP